MNICRFLPHRFFGVCLIPFLHCNYLPSSPRTAGSSFPLPATIAVPSCGRGAAAGGRSSGSRRPCRSAAGQSGWGRCSVVPCGPARCQSLVYAPLASGSSRLQSWGIKALLKSLPLLKTLPGGTSATVGSRWLTPQLERLGGTSLGP